MDPKFYSTLKQKSLQTLDGINSSDATDDNEIFKHNLNVLSELCDQMLNIGNTAKDTTSAEHCDESSKQPEAKRNTEQQRAHKPNSSSNKMRSRILKLAAFCDTSADSTANIDVDNLSSLMSSVLTPLPQPISDETGIGPTFGQTIDAAPTNLVKNKSKPVENHKNAETTTNCEPCAGPSFSVENINCNCIMHQKNQNSELLAQRLLTYTERKPRGRPRKKPLPLNTNVISVRVTNDVITLD